MCVSEGFGGSHNSQPRRFKAVGSTFLCYHSIIRLSIQNRKLIKNQASLLPRVTGHHKSDNRSYPDIERCY
jgi:hypothetical protein